MSSNLPPGVTGNEYAIGGAEREWEAEDECPLCGWIGLMHHEYHYEFGTRAWCANPDKDCPAKRDSFEIDMDIEYEPDLEPSYAPEREE